MQYKNIVAVMHTAKQQLEYPKMRMMLQNGKQIMFTIAGSRARFPGSINITNGESFSSANSKFYGRIKKFGTLQVYRDAPVNLEFQLELVENDPVAAAKIYGNATSNCCFCNRELTAPDSIANGYGEHCALNYNMPYVKQARIIHRFKPIQTEPVQLEFNLLKAGVK